MKEKKTSMEINQIRRMENKKKLHKECSGIII
jgi:hypothetical protein